MNCEIEGCENESMVTLNGVPLCAEHYDQRIAKIGEIVKRIPGAVGVIATPNKRSE